MLLRQRQTQQPELGEPRPERGGVAHGVVLELAGEIEPAVPRAGTAYRVTQQLLLGGEVHVHERCSSAQRCSGCQDSPRRVQGLSSGAVGMATRAVHVVARRSSACIVPSRGTPPQPASSTATTGTGPRGGMVSPGDTEA